jgi:plastocyanin
LAPLGRVLVVALVVAGAPTAEAETLRIELNKLTFTPLERQAHVGDTIEWVNSDFVAHTATARDHSFDVMLEPGKSGRYTVHKTGAVDYYCRFHPNMTGRITVGE